jgi:hypothetical protein
MTVPDGKRKAEAQQFGTDDRICWKITEKIEKLKFLE